MKGTVNGIRVVDVGTHWVAHSAGMAHIAVGDTADVARSRLLEEIEAHPVQEAVPGARWTKSAQYKRSGLSQERKAEVFERDGYLCRYCGTTEDLTIDHITAVSKGGLNNLGNLQCLCKRCNEAKGDS